MTSIIRNFNVDENFWVVNPGFLTIKNFIELHKSDRSKDKFHSSQKMWAIAYLIDPHTDNPWKNVAEEDKAKLLKEDFYDIDWVEYQHVIETYREHCLTLGEKDFIRLQNKMHERQNFIENTAYTLDTTSEEGRNIKGTALQLDKMVVDTLKIYEQLDQVKAKLEKEKSNEGSTKGGMQESAAEKGLL
jgi:hypothetical protein